MHKVNNIAFTALGGLTGLALGAGALALGRKREEDLKENPTLGIG